MPEWIHNRAEHLLAKNPSMEKGTAFAIATQQAHKVGKTPKGYGTAQGKREAKAKYDQPKKEYKKSANPGKLDSPKMPGKPKTASAFFSELSGILKEAKDQISGGKADDSDWGDFSKKQLDMGEKIELEHTGDPQLAREIAADHLEEFGDYYTRLKKMEAGAEKKSKEKESSAEEGYHTPSMQWSEGGSLPKNAGVADSTDLSGAAPQAQPESAPAGMSTGAKAGIGAGLLGAGALAGGLLRRRGMRGAMRAAKALQGPTAKAKALTYPSAHVLDSVGEAAVAPVKQGLEGLDPSVRSALQSRVKTMPGMTEDTAYSLLGMSAEQKGVPVSQYIMQELGKAASAISVHSFFDEMFKMAMFPTGPSPLQKEQKNNPAARLAKSQQVGTTEDPNGPKYRSLNMLKPPATPGVKLGFQTSDFAGGDLYPGPARMSLPISGRMPASPVAQDPQLKYSGGVPPVEGRRMNPPGPTAGTIAKPQGYGKPQTAKDWANRNHVR